MRSTGAWALLAALVVAPIVAAQDHAHDASEGVALVLRDGPDSGRAVVGAYTHFGFLLVGKDGAPAVHRDAEFSLVQDGVTLFSTTFAHEYDGHFSFDHTFTKPGPYVVTASSEKMNATIFSGEAILPVNETVAAVDITVEGARVAIAIVDPAGAIIPHTDAIAEVRAADGQRLVSRTHLHIHDAPIELELPSRLEAQELSVVAYKAFATGRSTDVRAVTAKAALPALPSVGAPALPAPALPMLLEPAGASASKDGYTLFTMYDPQNQVSAGHPLRFVGIFADGNGTPVPHVDFEFRLSGPQGALFASKSLHEYDGVFEHLALPSVPGVYEATMTATYDEVSITVPMQAEATPPVLPLGGAGPASVTLRGADEARAGVPVELTFFVGGPAGPIKHSEVDVTIFHDEEAPIHQFKLHTHGSGETAATVVFPHAGDWIVRVDPLPTALDPVVFDAPASIALAVAGADGEGEAPGATTEAPAELAVPAPGLAALLLAALAGAGVAALTRRRL